MDTEGIKQFLIDFQKRKFETLPRDLELKPSKHFITSIIGARRAGKTYFLFNEINKIKDRKKVLYIDFEYPQFMDFDGKNLKKIVDMHAQMFGEPEYLFFDEIQNLKNWERGLREIYEAKKYFIFITGSSAKFLSQELATALRGRAISYALFPFSFKEILKIKNIQFAEKFLSTEDKNKIMFEFNEYLKFGGYPQIFLEKKLKEQIVRDYKDLVLFKDLIERYSLKNIYVVKRFFEYLISSFAKEISIDKFYNYLKSQNVSLSKKTLYNYLEYFESSMFFHFLRTYKIKERLKKVYINDVALASDEKGRKLENIVYMELLRMGEKCYFSKNKLECDFIIPKKEAIQVSLELTDENKKREVRGLLEAMKYHRIKKGAILTYNEEGEVKESGRIIKIMPVWKWIIEK